MQRFGVIVCSLFFVNAYSQKQESSWIGRIGPSFGQPILGSEDTRRGTMYSIGYRKQEPRLTFRGSKADLLLEGYYLFTKGGGFENIPVNKMNSFGVLATAQYRLNFLRYAQAHLDLSFGAVYNSITTRDLDSNLNTTPCIGFGVTWKEYDFTIRWYHASNGGTDGNNQGTNQIQYLFGVRF